MKLSIITVCYNCECEIRKTLESVANQIYTDFEYIIIDGKSNDNTVKIAKEYQSKIKNMIVKSEMDMGIYDAMNKGVRIATKKWVYFLNAGDTFFDNYTTLNLKKYLDGSYDILYGNVLINNKLITYNHGVGLFDLIYLERMFCHQAIITRRDVLLEVPFDVNYKICADRDWLIKCLQLGKKIFYAEKLNVAVYDTSGISSTSPAFYHESMAIARKYGNLNACFFVKIKRCLGHMKRYIQRMS